MRHLLLICVFVFSSTVYCNDAVIYANSDGTYTYFANSYTLDQFPIMDVAAPDKTVQIFPEANLATEQALTSVRPLARKFIRLGYKVETRLFGKVIPYLVKKKGQ